MKKKYESDIALGERVSIETVVEGKIEEYAFDAARLVHYASGKQATTDSTGGPGQPVRRPGAVAR